MALTGSALSQHISHVVLSKRPLTLLTTKRWLTPLMMSKTVRFQQEEKRAKAPQEDWRQLRDYDYLVETEVVEFPEPELDYVWKTE